MVMNDNPLCTLLWDHAPGLVARDTRMVTYSAMYALDRVNFLAAKHVEPDIQRRFVCPCLVRQRTLRRRDGRRRFAHRRTLCEHRGGDSRERDCQRLTIYRFKSRSKRSEHISRWRGCAFSARLSSLPSANTATGARGCAPCWQPLPVSR